MLNADHLRSLLDYDRATGVFVWKMPAGRYGRIPAGTRAGSYTSAEGYGYVTIAGKSYRLSRLAWLYVHGEWPKDQIDHVNGDPSDDRIANLREATQFQNKANCRRYANNTSGFKGVSLDRSKGLYRAYTNKDGRRVYLGRYRTPEEAHAAYAAAAMSIHRDFARFT